MRVMRKLAVYQSLRFVNQMFFLFIALAGVGLVVNYVLKANEDVADYSALRVPTVVTAGSDVTYTFTFTKKVNASGDLYRSWLRMKPQGDKFVRDTQYVPLLVSGSFRVGRDKGTYTTHTKVKAPDTPGFYIFQIRGEYQRVAGADSSIDVKESNVVEVKPATDADRQAQIDALTGEINVLKNQGNSTAVPTPSTSRSPAASAAPRSTPTNSPVTPRPSPSVSPSPSPSPSSRPCTLGLLGLCILGT